MRYFVYHKAPQVNIDFKFVSYIEFRKNSKFGALKCLVNHSWRKEYKGRKDKDYFCPDSPAAYPWDIKEAENFVNQGLWREITEEELPLLFNL